MKRSALWRISIAIVPEAEEAVAALLEDIFSQPAVLYTNTETGATSATVFCQKPSALSPAKRGQLVSGLQRVKEGGVNIGLGKICVARIRPQDWAESWKRHFKPITVGRALLIKPSWSKCRPRRGQVMVVLDPGLSFGTGQHATTAFCLRQLVACRRQGPAQSFLDLGTGSGILAIAAAKLGYAPVHALDNDPQAIRVARTNALRNRVLPKIRFSLRDVTQLACRCNRTYDLICANLTDSVLLTARDPILARLRSNGMLVLAGILTAEFARVERAYEAAGLRLVVSRPGAGWRSGSFAFSHQPDE